MFRDGEVGDLIVFVLPTVLFVGHVVEFFEWLGF